MIDRRVVATTKIEPSSSRITPARPTEIRFLYGTIWVIVWGVLKTGFLLVFNIQFLAFIYLQTWDAPARVRDYPIKFIKVESLGLGLRFWGLNSHRPSQNSIFGGAPEKTHLVPD